MMDWKLIAAIAPITFVIYQSISKLLPKSVSIFLVNAYAFLIGALFMLVLHLFLSPDKSITTTSRTFFIAIGIGVLVSLGNYGIIKAYSLGAPQSVFTLVFYVALIIYGVLFGILFWHERLSFTQLFGALLSIAGILIIVYYKK